MDDREIDTSPGPSGNPPARGTLRGAAKPAPLDTKKKRGACARDEKPTKPKVKTAGK